LWTALGRFIDLFTPHECTNYFAAAGAKGFARGDHSDLRWLRLEVTGQVYDMMLERHR
jgi:hypothetical protein